MINQIQEDTGAEIAIEDDGTVYISSEGGEAAEKAKEIIDQIANPHVPEAGETYNGKVVKTTSFGAFVNLTPGTDGLLHISQIRNLANGERIDAVEDVLKEGDTVEVLTIAARSRWPSRASRIRNPPLRVVTVAIAMTAVAAVAVVTTAVVPTIAMIAITTIVRVAVVPTAMTIVIMMIVRVAVVPTVTIATTIVTTAVRPVPIAMIVIMMIVRVAVVPIAMTVTTIAMTAVPTVAVVAVVTTAPRVTPPTRTTTSTVPIAKSAPSVRVAACAATLIRSKTDVFSRILRSEAAHFTYEKPTGLLA